MRNNNGIAKGIFAILVAGALVAGVCCTGFVSRSDDGKWFRNGNLSTWHWSDKKDGDAFVKPDDPTTGDDPAVNIKADKFFVDNDENESVTEIELLSARIAPEEYAAYGISEQAESAVVISITQITPNYAFDKTATWNVDFVGQNTEWSAGKSLSDYMKYTVSEDTLSVTVECLQAFGDPIRFTAVMNSNTDITVSCTCNYVAIPAIRDVKISVYQQIGSEITSDFLEQDKVTEIIVTPQPKYRYRVNLDVTYGIGTVYPEVRKSANSTITFGSAYMYSDIKDQPEYSSRLKEMPMPESCIGSGITVLSQLFDTGKTGTAACDEVLHYMQQMAESMMSGRTFEIVQQYEVVYRETVYLTRNTNVYLGIKFEGFTVTGADISDTEIVFPVVS